MRTSSLLIGLAALIGVSAVLLSKSRCAHRSDSPRTAPAAREVKFNGKWSDPRGRQVVVEVQATPTAGGKELPETAIVEQKDGQGFRWQVVCKPQVTPEKAQQAALQDVQTKLLAHFEGQNTPLEWVPPLPYIKDRLVKTSRVDQRDFDSGVGTMYIATLEVRLTPEAQADIARHDREYRAQDRMAWLARVVLALVTLLGAVAGYVRLDELTKGYYTGWLRIAAGFIGTAALIVLLA